MLTINGTVLLTNSPLHSTAISSIPTAREKIEAVAASSAATISSLARQLSAAAKHAADCEKTLTPQQLRVYATTLQRQISGDAYQANKAHHDAQLPPTTDTDSIARAREATAFTNGVGRNPFQGMPRDHLSLIAYDENKNFTLNERRAAWQEIQSQEALFRKTIIKDAQHEYADSACLVQTASRALQHFKNLSVIEQVQYPPDYPDGLQKLTESGYHPALFKPLTPQDSETPPFKTLFDPASTPPPVKAPSIAREEMRLTRDENGHQLLLARRYGQFEPPVADRSKGLMLNDIGLPDTRFLTRQDRTLLSHVYTYAQEQGADLKYADGLVDDLAAYRRYNDGRILSNMNKGLSYDNEGRQLSSAFTPENAVIAKRILGSQALNSSQLDKGFIRFALDPGYHPYSQRCDLRFLEQVIEKFSSETRESYTLDSRFSTHSRERIKNTIVSASEAVRRPPSPEPLARMINGVLTLTAKGKAAGYVADPVSGIIVLNKPEEKNAKRAGHFLDGFFDSPGKNNRLPTPFALMLMKYKAQGRVRGL